MLIVVLTSATNVCQSTSCEVVRRPCEAVPCTCYILSLSCTSRACSMQKGRAFMHRRSSSAAAACLLTYLQHCRPANSSSMRQRPLMLRCFALQHAAITLSVLDKPRALPPCNSLGYKCVKPPYLHMHSANMFRTRSSNGLWPPRTLKPCNVV